MGLCYSFCQIIQGLRLFQTLEYMYWSIDYILPSNQSNALLSGSLAHFLDHYIFAEVKLDDTTDTTVVSMISMLEWI